MRFREKKGKSIQKKVPANPNEKKRKSSKHRQKKNKTKEGKNKTKQKKKRVKTDKLHDPALHNAVPSVVPLH